MFLALLACAAPPDSGTTEFVSEAGLYTMTLGTDPDPLVAGEVTLLADVPGTTSLEVEGSMAGMSHGLGADPVVTGGDGAWDVQVLFSMSGTWKLTFTLDGDHGPDTLVAELEVR